MRALQVGDPVFVYHSGEDKAVVGTATVTRTRAVEADSDDGWISVTRAADAPLPPRSYPYRIGNGPCAR